MIDPFPTTQWSAVKRAGEAGGGSAALGELLVKYLPALRAHLIRTRRIRPNEVDDLLQGFVADKVIHDRLIGHADRYRGKFRTFLLATLDNYLVSTIRHERSQRRSPGKPMLDVTEVQIAGGSDAGPGGAFDVAWARQVLAQTMARMQAECERSGQPHIWQVFVCRVLEPIFNQAPVEAYKDLVDRFAFASPTQAANALITGKRMFKRNLRLVISEYARDAAEVEEELASLRAILGRGGA